MNANTYAAYAEYDALRVVRRSETVGITLDGWKVRHQVIVFDFGKPQRAPADPDAAMTPDENLFPRRIVQTKTVTLAAQINELLATRPMNCGEIGAALGCTTARVRKYFSHHPNGYVVLARGLYGSVWGLEGVDYGAVYTGALGRVVEHLRAHGPQTAREICEGLGMGTSTFYAVHERHPGILRCVEVRRADNPQGGLVQVWEIAS